MEAAEKLGGPVWVVKAQIHAGGRGKGGGVKVAKSLDDVRARATTSWACGWSRTRPARKARRSAACTSDGADIGGGSTSRWSPTAARSVAFIASSEGGMDIEEVALEDP